MTPRTYRYALADVETNLWVALFLLGALLAVVVKAWLGLGELDRYDEADATVYVFGPGASEPERSACEARRRKELEEDAGE